MIFSIAMGADYSFYVKSIATCAPTFFGYIISVLASVSWLFQHNVRIFWPYQENFQENTLNKFNLKYVKVKIIS